MAQKNPLPNVVAQHARRMLVQEAPVKALSPPDLSHAAERPAAEAAKKRILRALGRLHPMD